MKPTKNAKSTFSVENLTVKLWFRAEEAPLLKVAQTDWSDILPEHYTAFGGILPIAEFGSMCRLLDWLNTSHRYINIGYPREFKPDDILVGSVRQQDGTLCVVPFLYETLSRRVMSSQIKNSGVVEGQVVMTKIPMKTEVSEYLRKEHK